MTHAPEKTLSREERNDQKRREWQEIQEKKPFIPDFQRLLHPDLRQERILDPANPNLINRE